MGASVKTRAARRAAGLCDRCGKAPAGTRKNGKPSTSCATCLETTNANMKRLQAARKAAGVCVVCGGPRDPARSKAYCPECLTRHYDRMKARAS